MLTPDWSYSTVQVKLAIGQYDCIPAYLAVCINDRSQKLPGASSAVHAQHAQDLQEAHASQC